ncbi:RNA-binding protein [Pullulanibacillus pueri]|uniref:RNA-binding protein n=1 Tax=Pullulanibacillus pueri TaxID=1437324 RepID=A0A8J2ZY91_9BACL|nr:ribosome assembly RNA-binding protein YhbY [Pullulanibacillus pueri]MBM7683077.1 RNA-binding protein [Pullulanibacillus pueri]GGH84877.1 RNA-binding protein [Pullulanibacillus pueri]
MLTGKQKRFLRKEAHHLKPIFQIGKAGLHETMFKEINDVLEARELIKISVLQNAIEDPNEAGQVLAEKTEAEFVQVLGNVITLYKKSENNPNLQLPR